MINRSSKIYVELAIKKGWIPIKSETNHQKWMDGSTKFDSVYQIDGKVVWKVECPHCQKKYYPGSTKAMLNHTRRCIG